MLLMHCVLSTRGNEVSLNKTLVRCIFFIKKDITVKKIYYIKILGTNNFIFPCFSVVI